MQPATETAKAAPASRHGLENSFYAWQMSCHVYIHAQAQMSRVSLVSRRAAPVPEKVWNFHIGGYQVLQKYLKDRKGRQLSLDDIRQVERIANVLAFTIGHMQRIDEAYRQIFNLPQDGGQVGTTD